MKHNLLIPLCVCFLIIGVVLSFEAVKNLKMLGTQWDTAAAIEQDWPLAPFLIVSAKDAFDSGGIFAMWLGGACAGLGVAIFPKRFCIPSFFGAIIFTGLGFNTLDWMEAQAIASTGALWRDTWMFYFFSGILPIWIGGFFILFAVIVFFRHAI
jgi:hypothetical protein